MKIAPHRLILLGIPLLFMARFSPIRIYYNHTNSMPLGFYLINKWHTTFTKSDLVVICLPSEQIKALAISRGYVKKSQAQCNHEPLVKRIYGMPHNKYYVSAEHIFIAGQSIPNSTIYESDSSGRPLPYLQSGYLQNKQYLVFGNSTDSFDSRYFGAINESNIIGKAYYIGKLL